MCKNAVTLAGDKGRQSRLHHHIYDCFSFLPGIFTARENNLARVNISSGSVGSGVGAITSSLPFAMEMSLHPLFFTIARTWNPCPKQITAMHVTAPLALER
jgi:hypothetical protein